MFEFYIRRFFVKILCWFIPTKKLRLKLNAYFGFGNKKVLLDEIDSNIPIKDKINKINPLSFLSSYKEKLNPMPLKEIISLSNSTPPTL
ncbi:hypothetical protein [Helicobacter sp. MIT 14-3879]|uniref:hypothetical protein n=1 Tax=Helicobacter sp. MIT 14-3879 TaxID=2040649 RepID=UPI000E1EE4A2|nr:hypothetical protein [Helicobacter sp. MIT 14-3879]RDU62262.1 hypothetical protein CQA44_07145 [Helicobacter sp. MIT 14-3879]